MPIHADKQKGEIPPQLRGRHVIFWNRSRRHEMVQGQSKTTIQFGDTWPCTLVPNYSDQQTLKL
jgi:hypothetical protein